MKEEKDNSKDSENSLESLDLNLLKENISKSEKSIKKASDQARMIPLQVAQEKQDLELTIMKKERGIEAIEERIREKDNTIDDLKETIKILKELID